jgi:alpha-1,6-mannosyltransferase
MGLNAPGPWRHYPERESDRTGVIAMLSSDSAYPQRSLPRSLLVGAGAARLVDTTMLYAPRSGGVKRYLDAKRAWLARSRPRVRHTLIVPGKKHGDDGAGRLSIYAAPLPFGDGYRWPASRTAWMKRILRENPDLIEAGDPYTPGLAALKAGEILGAPVVGFCHTDLAALAALHIGEWAEKPVRRHWAEIYRRFDRVTAPSHFIAARLAEAGVDDPVAVPLGVDTDIFRPGTGDAAGLRRRLGLNRRHRILVFAGRPAREKRVDVLVETVQRLGDPYVLLLIGASGGVQPAFGAHGSRRVIELPYVSDPRALCAILAGCDAFVHANDAEPFGLVVLEAMACGLPVVGVNAGGVGESVDEAVGQLADESTSEAIAEAVDGLFCRDTREVGRAARKRAVDRHGWDATFARLSRLYEELTGKSAFATPTVEEGVMARKTQ